MLYRVILFFLLLMSGAQAQEDDFFYSPRYSTMPTVSVYTQYLFSVNVYLFHPRKTYAQICCSEGANSKPDFVLDSALRVCLANAAYLLAHHPGWTYIECNTPLAHTKIHQALERAHFVENRTLIDPEADWTRHRLTRRNALEMVD